MGNATAQHIVAFVAYTISSSVVFFYIFTLLKSLRTTNQSSDNAPTAEDPSGTTSASTNTNDPKPGDKIIFWSSFIGIVMFFIRSFIVWSCFFVILVTGEDIQETDANIPLDLSFTAYALALWTMSLSFVLRIDYGFKNTFLG